MKTYLFPFLFLITISYAIGQTPTPAPPPTKDKVPTVQERVEVTATRLPEDPEKVPAPIEVFSGDELQARGARDLRTAMASAIGVEIAPGGDAGPAGSVPAFWGLKEFDAFLLVVDGVPWGGAFNPALTTLDLNDIDRIEVLRGPAPVTYGATSFVGVIQVVHKDAAAQGRTLTLHGGSYGSGGGSFSTPIPLGTWNSRLSVDGERVGFRDERTDYRRGHALWRVGSKPVNDQRVWFNVDVNWLDQNPPSPRPVEEGDEEETVRRFATDPLLPEVPVDANHNPAGAFLDNHAYTLMGGFDRKVAGAQWSTSASFSQNRQDIFRGFLTPPLDPDAGPDAEAHGIREKITLTDFYIDSHFSWKLPRAVTFLAGMDYLHGTGNAKGADFDYEAPFDGKEEPHPDDLPTILDVTIHDHRDFFGPYGSAEWQATDRLRIDAGIRLNITRETRDDADPGAETSDHDERTDVRVGANVGAIFTAWQHDQDVVNLYVNYRDTFKPAAIDFGIGENDAGGDAVRQMLRIRKGTAFGSSILQAEEDGGTILKPETARSVEGGLRGRLWNRRVEWEASGFFMNFSNLVVPTVDEDGNPHLVNAGSEQFKGFEGGASFFLPHDLIARANYTYHDDRFTHFSALADDGSGVIEVFDGKRIEVSPLHLAAVSLFYTPTHGFLGGVSMNYTGSRFLNRDNTISAEGFPTVDLSAGYRTPRWEIRVDARNVGNRRDPVAESELGPDQFYLMTNRRIEGGLTFHF